MTTHRIWPMYRSMVGVGLVCGLAIVVVFQLTGPVIERNRAEALQRAIFEVLPEAHTSRTFSFSDKETTERVHAAYDANRRLVGLAIEAEGMGYQDVIRLLYGYSPTQQAIVGVRVLESKETPGLGDKIENDPAFLDNFAALDVTLSGDLQTLQNPIVAVKHGEKQNAWEVDGITGATISSVAIADMLRRSATYWIPRLRRDLESFESTEP